LIAPGPAMDVIGHYANGTQPNLRPRTFKAPPSDGAALHRHPQLYHGSAIRTNLRGRAQEFQM
jgi:hypothetical protein